MCKYQTLSIIYHSDRQLTRNIQNIRHLISECCALYLGFFFPGEEISVCQFFSASFFVAFLPFSQALLVSKRTQRRTLVKAIIYRQIEARHQDLLD